MSLFSRNKKKGEAAKKNSSKKLCTEDLSNVSGGFRQLYTQNDPTGNKNGGNRR